MSAKSEKTARPIDLIKVKKANVDDLKFALKAGWKDFLKRPLMSMFFGAIFTVIGIIIISNLLYYNKIWLIVPFMVGFPLIAPFAAAGLYEMSRRHQLGQRFTWGNIFTVVLQQQKKEFGWMAFVVLFIFWFWIYQARLLFAIFLQWDSVSSFDEFLIISTTTTNGLGLIGVGTIVGAFWATVLFTITVIAMPLLLDRKIDFISAMLTSIKTVSISPVTMLGWGFFIAVLLFLSMLPAFIGLIFTLPILGHATWHLYERLIEKLD